MSFLQGTYRVTRSYSFIKSKITRKLSGMTGTTASKRDAPFLVSPEDLKDAREVEGAKIVTLDASWHMPNSTRNARKEYLSRRLPGARFLDLDAVASEHKLGLKHMLPAPGQFARACEELGIDPDTYVVVYDSYGIFSSPRALYMFRAFGHSNSSVLDGGLPRWEAEGFPIENEQNAPPELIPEDQRIGTYQEPELDTSVVKNYEQIVSNASRDPAKDPRAAIVLDARPNSRFTGKDPEPRPGLSSGHMPHALSLPFSSFLQTHAHPVPARGNYTTFLPPDELKDVLTKSTLLGEAGTQDVVEGKRSVIASCGSGMTAGVLWLGLKMLGVQSPAIYDESWTGYAMRESSKIVKDV